MLHCAAFGALMRPLSVQAQAIIDDDAENEAEGLISARKPLLLRMAEEKRNRPSSLLYINGSEMASEKYMYYYSRGQFINMEPGVHSILELDKISLQPGTQPGFESQSLAPIKETPSDGENSSKEDKLDESENSEENKEKNEDENEKDKEEKEKEIRQANSRNLIILGSINEAENEKEKNMLIKPAGMFASFLPI